ncbi:hypothetical protein BJ875DRAFT_466574 [Amylocarpus encephaloides]|uniref:DUF3074 domain-containing protein n=1 Tax=Amylocarpus encephaloides TaxID=45428 RepID=A0A9P8C3F7_9HELO|nr:hypothetical protein BJ875DRAFT_466574 [Amylocarpus encephaloides]
MAALHDALKTLGPLEFSEAPTNNLNPFLSRAFSKSQLIVDSVPIPAPASTIAPDGRSRSSSNTSSEVFASNTRSPSPASDVEALQKEWKPVKLAASQNPLGMNVYKCSGKDGKGAWFARRSVHEGLGFTKWKKALEREFPETMKVQGGPGEGNIRGIGGERRVEFEDVEGVGKMEVYLLSAQFPGPTTPRDFVTMFLTSDQALSKNEEGETPRHFMVISRPCSHPDTPAREGFIRGAYESVEFIREIPLKRKPQKSMSTTDLSSNDHSRKRSGSALSKDAIVRNAKQNHPQANGDNPETQRKGSVSDTDLNQSDSKSEGRGRGHTISFDKSRGSDAKGERMDVDPQDDESESNPIEWIMITRSDPGGSVPRFMIERGTPGGIVSDATKFLDWACGKDMDEFERDEATGGADDQGGKYENFEPKRLHRHETDLHNYQTNGHLAGIEEVTTPTTEKPQPKHDPDAPQEWMVGAETSNSSGLYAMITGAAGAASGYISSHTPQVISDRIPALPAIPGYSTTPLRTTNGHHEGGRQGTPESIARQSSVSSIHSASSVGSFASAIERYATANEDGLDTSSQKTTRSEADSRAMALQDKELQKLEEKKRKLDEKLNKQREKELSKKREDSEKEAEVLRKAQEQHEREVKKQEEKYKKEVEKLEQKKAKEAKKAEERKRKLEEKDEKIKLSRELEEVKAEVELLRKEKEILRLQVGDLQAENTALATKVGKLGLQGEEVLREIRKENLGRLRASSFAKLVGAPSFRSAATVKSSRSGESAEGKEKEKENIMVVGNGETS